MTIEDECRAPHGAFASSASATSGGEILEEAKPLWRIDPNKVKLAAQKRYDDILTSWAECRQVLSEARAEGDRLAAEREEIVKKLESLASAMEGQASEVMSLIGEAGDSEDMLNHAAAELRALLARLRSAPSEDGAEGDVEGVAASPFRSGW